ncbi:hypothetical protein [cf. Phormidesmis sp. LEGE 11477]|uniref:hypothetical protein n=1 Tax=cf. Phormidesmis sp. LEGE 11477 TaxID=1828680 RepID=UPI00187FB2DB|nr:hypothetical protein [cf. Phormidesmis sp. LEGE 11477]MBE9062237.1 hypothetical protein [cf. Phormidesmis sp. LEGE 11477]
MKRHQRRNLKKQAQTILFCAVLIWATFNAIASGAAMAFQPATAPSVLDGYEDVVVYNGYAYGTSADGGEAIASKATGEWKLSCAFSHHLSNQELLGPCGLPIGTARHMKVLRKKGINHELFVS